MRTGLCRSNERRQGDGQPRDREIQPRRYADWNRAFAADGKANAVTEPSVVLWTQWHVEVTGDRAYVVAPSSFLYRVAGKATKESGANFAFALKKSAHGWLIEAWSWSTNVRT